MMPGIREDGVVRSVGMAWFPKVEYKDKKELTVCGTVTGVDTVTPERIPMLFHNDSGFFDVDFLKEGE